MTKQILCRPVLTIPLHDCTLDEMLQKLNECKVLHPTENLQISYDGEYMQYTGPDEMQVHYYSEETDEEYNHRLEWERKQLEEKELKELNRLLSYKTLNYNNQHRLTELLEKYNNG